VHAKSQGLFLACTMPPWQYSLGSLLQWLFVAVHVASWRLGASAATPPEEEDAGCWTAETNLPTLRSGM